MKAFKFFLKEYMQLGKSECTGGSLFLFKKPLVVVQATVKLGTLRAPER